ncbi:hypothetical protein F3Y22_tig00111402pilonHSYRG00244 [Hibiscus syriacus]|uniref:Uncharacterized protein n=1 Tax=Hibiscus syriacus TaxID=106335 RepID=A0A6A2YL44_HIBSY|nr:hypothetical protein F3Y22_tig00111402pilonHSYRG00244 [Hibiscus syriacus]
MLLIGAIRRRHNLHCHAHHDPVVVSSITATVRRRRDLHHHAHHDPVVVPSITATVRHSRSLSITIEESLETFNFLPLHVLPIASLSTRFSDNGRVEVLNGVDVTKPQSEGVNGEITKVTCRIENFSRIKDIKIYF